MVLSDTDRSSSEFAFERKSSGVPGRLAWGAVKAGDVGLGIQMEDAHEAGLSNTSSGVQSGTCFWGVVVKAVGSIVPSPL